MRFSRAHLMTGLQENFHLANGRILCLSPKEKPFCAVRLDNPEYPVVEKPKAVKSLYGSFDRVIELASKNEYLSFHMGHLLRIDAVLPHLIR